MCHWVSPSVGNLQARSQHRVLGKQTLTQGQVGQPPLWSRAEVLNGKNEGLRTWAWCQALYLNG